MAAAPSSQQMDINENEEQQIIEVDQPQAAEVEGPSSPERAPSMTDLKPPINHIENEKEAKIHLINSIIYNTLSSDSSCHTPPSQTISKIYDSSGTIMMDGIDLASMASDCSLITLVDHLKQTEVLKATTPWDLSHQSDPISVFIILDDITYGKFISTGSIILEGIEESMPYVHRHPHLHQSPLAAINFCIVVHAIHRISGKPKTHESHILVHLKLEPASLIASNTLMGFSRPSHPDQELENIMKHMPNISQYARTSCCFQGPPSSLINEATSSEGFAEHHLLDYSSISGPNFLAIPSPINNAATWQQRHRWEGRRFIGAFHPAYINLIKGVKRQHQSSGDQQTWKSHRAASSMTTSVNKDGSIHINVKYD